MRIKIQLTILFMLCSVFCYSQNGAEETLQDIMHEYTVSKYRYWFDEDEQPYEETYVNGSLSLDCSALEEGFHSLHFQLVTTDGAVSPAYTQTFFRMKNTNEEFKGYTIQSLNYWVDQETEMRQTAYRSGAAVLNLADLEEGFHSIHYQVVTTDGTVSPAYTQTFFRMKNTNEEFKGYTVQSMYYWVDQETEMRQTAYRSGAAVLNLADLEEGFHTLHYQVKTADGMVSPTYTCSFFRISPTKEHFKDYAIKTIRYWLDNDESTSTTGNYADGILQLNLSHFSEGEHSLTFQVVADDGSLSPATTYNFYRSLYDVYVRSNEEYTQSTIAADAVLSNKPDLKLHYETAQPDVRGHLTVANDATLSLGKFVQTMHLGSNNTTYKYQRTGEEYYHPTTLINNGIMQADNVIVKQNIYRDRWHFISLPFNVSFADIKASNGAYWALREYDGEQRASGNMTSTWKNLRPGSMMKAGQGYIVQATAENRDKSIELTFASANDAQKNAIFTTNDVEVNLSEYEAEFSHNRGWNFIGNPYPSFYDTRNIDQLGTITVWNGNGYSAYSLQDDNYILMPFEAFFIQKPLDKSNIVFQKEGRQHTETANVSQSSKARRLQRNPNRIIYNIRLSDENNTDRSRIVLNDDAALDYETDKDAVKFMEQTPTTPQIYSVEAGVQYAINERPLNDGVVNLSIYLPEHGTYTIHMDESATDVWLIDTEMNIKTPLNKEAYSFEGAKGTYNERFFIAFNDPHTSVENITYANQGDVRVIDHTLSFNLINQCNVKVFGVNGTMFYNEKRKCDQIELIPGIYILDINGKSMKAAIK